MLSFFSNPLRVPICLAALIILASYTVNITPQSASAQTSSSKPSFEAGQEIEVREGDEWSAATVVKKEGRKIQIRYDDGTEEWVAGDRLRAKGTAGSDANEDKPDETASSETTKAKPAESTGKKRFKSGDKVEILWGSSWYPGKLINVRAGSYFVSYDGWSDSFNEWVSLDRIKRPGDAEPETPGRSRTSRTSRASGERDTFRQNEPDDPDRPLTEADTSSAEKVDLATAPSGFTPDPAPETKLAPKSIGLNAATGIRSFPINGVEIGQDSALVSFNPVFKNKGETPRIERVDLTTGKSTNVWPLFPEMKLAGYRADGKLAAIQSDRFFGNTKGRIDIYLLSKDKPKYQVGFLPFETLDKDHRDVTWLAFVDKKYLLTAGASNLVLWELPTCKAVWMMPLSGSGTPALSPGGKQVAVSINGAIVVLDAVTGALLAKIPNAFGAGPVAFSPDGSLIVVSVSGGSLCMFDIAKGELLSRMAVQGGGSPQWVDGAHVLIGSQLYSLKRQMPLWTYTTSSRFSQLQAANGLVWYAAEDSGPLVACRLPSEEALKAEASIGPSHYMLVPGSSVSLEINLPNEGDKVTTGLTKQLADLGITVAAGQPVKLRASITPGQSKEMSYEIRTFGRGFQRETVKRTVSESIHALEFVDAEGKVGWKQSTVVGAPFFLSVQEGQTVDDALQKATAPRIEWFNSVKLPGYVPKPEFANGLGRSMLTAQGVVPVAAK